jgi:hypothetical protein
MRTWYQLMVDAIDLFGDAMNDEVNRHQFVDTNQTVFINWLLHIVRFVFKV